MRQNIFRAVLAVIIGKAVIVQKHHVLEHIKAKCPLVLCGYEHLPDSYYNVEATDVLLYGKLD
jgi:hypothetical protein